MINADSIQKPIISLKNISRNYTVGSLKIKAIDNISFDIYAGNFIFIMGPSGSGKTTLLNLITGLDQPSDGNIHLNLNNKLKNLARLNKKQLEKFRRYNVGIIFQFFNLISILTVFENVLLSALLVNKNLNDANRKSLEYLKLVGIEEKAEKYPYQLSGGEQQRVAIARALVKECDIIFADEPTGNLDNERSQEIFSLLKKINEEKKKTIIVVSHDFKLANKYAKTRMRLIDGKISEVVKIE